MRITRVFIDVYMGYGFQGLSEIAKEAKTNIGPESCVVFINRKTTAFKMMVDGIYLTYFKNGEKKIPIDAIRFLPEKFGGTQMEFDRAVKKSLETKLGKWA